ncbi:MAG: OmpA family protein [bacterium]
MRKIFRFSSILFLIFGCSNQPEIKIFDGRKYESSFVYLIGTNLLMFPDTIIFRFTAGSRGQCELEKGILTESVENNVDTIDYIIYKTHNTLPRKLWVVEDCSGSLAGERDKADSVYLFLRSILKEGEDIGLIRFGENAIKIFNSKKNRLTRKKFLTYPNPNGTNIQKALEMIIADDNEPVRSTNIFLFSDGDFSFDFPTDSFLAILKNNNFRLFSVGIGAIREGMLEELSSRSGGFFIKAKNLGTMELANILYEGSKKYYTIKYSPKSSRPDGKDHKVSFHSHCFKTISFSYKAPYVEQIAMPVAETTKTRALDEPFIIPFFEPNNYNITPNGLITLDSVISIIESKLCDKPVILRIDGYTCSLGDSIYNINLSRMRARVVERYLKEKFKANRELDFVVNWHGERSPRYPNDDESSRTLNRRVEIKLYVKEGI